MQSRVIKILLTIAVVAGGAGMLVYSSMAEAEYYKHVDELLAEPTAWEGKSLRIHGFVQPGTIHEEIEGQTTKRSFVLEYNGQRIEVRNEGPKPDTFRDLAEVVAKGELSKDNGTYVLNATELSAKCPSKYEEGQRTKEYGQPPPQKPPSAPSAQSGPTNGSAAYGN